MSEIDLIEAKGSWERSFDSLADLKSYSDELGNGSIAADRHRRRWR